MVYEYEKTLPVFFNLATIKTEVDNSSMTNKDLEYSRYDSGDAEAEPPVAPCLKISFTGELVPDDKTILDGIVASL